MAKKWIPKQFRKEMGISKKEMIRRKERERNQKYSEEMVKEFRTVDGDFTWNWIIPPYRMYAGRNIEPDGDIYLKRRPGVKYMHCIWGGPNDERYTIDTPVVEVTYEMIKSNGYKKYVSDALEKYDVNYITLASYDERIIKLIKKLSKEEEEKWKNQLETIT